MLVSRSAAWPRAVLVAVMSLFIISAHALHTHHHAHNGHRHSHMARHYIPRDGQSASGNNSSDAIDRWVQQNPELAATIPAAKLEQFRQELQYGGNATFSSSLQRRETSSASQVVRKRENATNAEIDSARDIVNAALDDVGADNAKIRASPRLNNYYFQPKSGSRLRSRSADVVFNETVVNAAAIVAEADAKAKAMNGTIYNNFTLPEGFPSPPGHGGDSLEKRATSGSFWLETVGAQSGGSFPLDPSHPSDYAVFRNVKDFGAKGDGLTDDTAAINRAISSGGRCGKGCGSTSVKGAVVYFPPGTYLVSTPIILYYNTQMIGDYNNLPIIRASTSFTGLGVISADVYLAEGEWYIDTNNFFRSVRNFIIDLTWATVDSPAGVHWQVAQATSLENMYFYLSSDPSKKQVGVFAENGSGGFMSELIFYSGYIGLQCGNQQFTTRNLQFLNSITGISLLWDWGWTFKSIHISGAETGIAIQGDTVGGSVYLLDTLIEDTAVGIAMPATTSDLLTTNYLNVDNLHLSSVPKTITQGTKTILSSGDTTVPSWVYGRIYTDLHTTGTLWKGAALSSENHHPMNNGLGGGPYNGYLERERPQYNTRPANQFINAHSITSGNGVDDDTAGLSLLFSVAAADGYVAWIPAGTYIVTDTVDIPSGAFIVGECWSQIMASGSNFQDMANPHPMVRVGAEGGESGSVEIQNLLFTVRGHTAGAVLMQWNMNQTSPASAGMWDSHFRVGGAVGSNLQKGNCPTLTGKVNSNCIAASMHLHLTSTSSAYLENVWAWTADHDMDDPAQTQIDVYSARGILIESQGPTWMYGTACEHNVLYQYMVYNAENIFMGMIQTESPYYPPAPQAPAPFSSVVGIYNSDPNFDGDCQNQPAGCAVSWALYVKFSTNIQIGGAGLYSWFQDYDEDCVNTQNCQLRLVHTEGNTDLYINNLYTIGATEMIVPTYSNLSTALATPNTNQAAYPWLAVIATWVDLANDDYVMCDWNDTESWCDADPVCDMSLSFATLDDIQAAASSIPSPCLDAYTLPILSTMIDDALTNYTDVNNGYDTAFGYYVEYIQELLPGQISEFMADDNGPGNKYFTCTWNENGVNRSTTACPNTVAANGEIYYTLTNATGFYAELAATYGIIDSWVKFGEFTRGACHQPDPRSCPGGVSAGVQLIGYPQAADNVDVPNPKDVVTLALANITTLEMNIAATALDIWVGQWDGANDDVVQTASVPVFMLQQAVDTMYTVKGIGEAQEKADQENLILTIISGVLFFVPLLGEAADAIDGVASLARMIDFIDAAGNAAVSVADIVQDPQSAPMAIMGLLLSSPDVRNPDDFASLAKTRKAMDKDTTDALGSVFQANDNTLQSIVKKCK